MGSGDVVEIRFRAIGTSFVNGISSKYDDTFPKELDGVLEANEFDDIVRRLNKTLQELWPCGPAYYCGLACCLCSCGVSLLVPNVCVSEAEKHAQMMLSNVSNRSKFYDKGVAFRLQRGFMSSNFVVSFPKHLQREADIERGKRGQAIVRVDEPSASRLKSV